MTGDDGRAAVQENLEKVLAPVHKKMVTAAAAAATAAAGAAGWPTLPRVINDGGDTTAAVTETSEDKRGEIAARMAYLSSRGAAGMGVSMGLAATVAVAVNRTAATSITPMGQHSSSEHTTTDGPVNGNPDHAAFPDVRGKLPSGETNARIEDNSRLEPTTKSVSFGDYRAPSDPETRQQMADILANLVDLREAVGALAGKLDYEGQEECDDLGDMEASFDEEACVDSDAHGIGESDGIADDDGDGDGDGDRDGDGDCVEPSGVKADGAAPPISMRLRGTRIARAVHALVSDFSRTLVSVRRRGKIRLEALQAELQDARTKEAAASSASSAAVQSSQSATVTAPEEALRSLREVVAKLEHRNDLLQARADKLMEEKAALLEKQAELLTSTAEATSRAFDMQQQMETLRKEKAALEARLADVDDD
jgi:hypothetical protein